MSEQAHGSGRGTISGFTVTTSTRDLADVWGLVLTYGLVTLGTGLVLALWPGETLTVLTVLLAIQLIITGSVRMFLALGSASLDRGSRWLVGGTGTLAVVVGVLCLVDPMRTLEVIGILIGVFWIVAGLGDLAAAFVSDTRRERVWDVVKGVISLGAGVFLVANPEVSLGFLVLISCIWLLGYGLIVCVEAFRLRSSRDASPLPSS
jgi:uncharacterized membrane protein HdeD (DUF308 family)